MAHKVIHNLYLGNKADSESFGAHVEFIVNCTSDLPFHGCSSTQKQVRLPIEDNGDPRQQDEFVLQMKSTGVIERVLDSIIGGGTVLVHCMAGRQRSAAFVAILLVKMGVCKTVDDAVIFVKSKKRDAFFPEANFDAAMRRVCVMDRRLP